MVGDGRRVSDVLGLELVSGPSFLWELCEAGSCKTRPGLFDRGDEVRRNLLDKSTAQASSGGGRTRSQHIGPWQFGGVAQRSAPLG